MLLATPIRLIADRLGEGLGGEGLGRRLPADAGAGDQQIGGADLALQQRHGRLHAGAVGHVGDGDGAPAARAFQFRLQRGKAVGRQVECGDAGAFAAEKAGELAADAAGGPGDQCDAVGERLHDGSEQAARGLSSPHYQVGGGYASSGTAERRLRLSYRTHKSYGSYRTNGDAVDR